MLAVFMIASLSIRHGDYERRLEAVQVEFVEYIAWSLSLFISLPFPLHPEPVETSSADLTHLPAQH